AVNVHAFGSPLECPSPVLTVKPKRSKRASSFEIWPWSVTPARSPTSRFETPGTSAMHFQHPRGAISKPHRHPRQRIVHRSEGRIGQAGRTFRAGQIFPGG